MQEISQPVVGLALCEEVANQLRDRIDDESPGAGEWIDEESICEDLGISRTPLREVLKVLCGGSGRTGAAAAMPGEEVRAGGVTRFVSRGGGTRRTQCEVGGPAPE